MPKILIIIILFSTSIFAQFGKNIVQYEEFDWKYISTTNFDVYFHQGGDQLAFYAGVELEKALTRIESQLNYKLQNRINVLIFNSHNQFAQNSALGQFFSEGVGGVTGLFKNRILMPFQGNYAEFRHLIGHELVHGVLNDLLHGGSLRQSFTQGGYFLPTWMNEGFAEYSSRNGMDPETDQFMRELTISEQLPALNQINGYLSYRAGQTFYWYIAREYGEQKVGELINKMQAERNPKLAFESAFKMDIEEFSEKWKRDIKKYYLPDIEKFENPKDYAVAVTDRKKMMNFFNSSPAVSPDGEKIAFISETNGLLGLSVMEIDDMDSKRELVSSFRQQDFEDLNILTPGISWSPDGKRIAMSAKAGPRDAVYIIEEESGEYAKLDLGFNSIGTTKWSPDGSYLIFSATVKEKSDIYLYKFKTKEITNLTNDIYSDQMPAWSSDSKSIFFISDRLADLDATNTHNMWHHTDKSSDIYKIDIQSQQIERITKDPQYKKTSIAAGPNNSLYYVSNKNGIDNIYKLDMGSNVTKPITNSLTSINQISISPDGSKLLFGTQINSGYDIFMLRFPEEIDLEIDELPLTKYRESQIENEREIEDEQIQEILEEEEEDALISYGDFQLDFENDELIESNPDAPRQDISDLRTSTPVDTNFVVKDYKVNLTSDFAYAAPGYNTFFSFQSGIQYMLSDMIGDHSIYVQANLLGTLNKSNILVDYSYKKKVIDYNFQAYHWAFFTQTLNRNLNSFNQFRDYGLNFKGSYAFSLFKRFEFGSKLRVLSVQEVNTSNPVDMNILMVPEVRYVFDNSLGGPWAPVIGARYYLRMYGSPKLGESGLEFLTLDAAYRQYLRIIPGWLNFAGRVSAGASFGLNANTFNLGGNGFGWLNARNRTGLRTFFDTPQDFAFMLFQSPLRGWALRELEGSKFAMANLELRFPLIQALLAGPVPILIQGIQGSFFLDVGTAFNYIEEVNTNAPNWVPQINDLGLQEFDLNGNPLFENDGDGSLLLSTGMGIRSAVLNLPLKIDIAWARLPNGWSKPQYLFSFGFDF